MCVTVETVCYFPYLKILKPSILKLFQKWREILDVNVLALSIVTRESVSF